jgi:imidazolonepropionase-like amidohydrolase
MSMAKLITRILLTVVMTMTAMHVFANDEAQPLPMQILFKNVNIFDGKSDTLAMGQNVLVEGNLIKQIGPNLSATPETEIIDGDGRTLLPGFIDNHVHLVLTGANLSAIESMDWGQIAYASVPVAEMYLMEGFTTVRDAGGAPAALRQAIDKGDLVGPRLYTAISFLGGRGGHADFATYSSEPDGKTNMNRLNMAQ